MRGKDISERVVVRPDYKLVPIFPIRRQVFMELLGDCPLEGEEFLFVGMIPLLGVIHNPTRISDRMVASIGLLLRKNSPEAFTRCVCLKEERFIEVRKSQNGGLKTGRLEVFKSLKSFGREVHSL